MLDLRFVIVFGTIVFALLSCASSSVDATSTAYASSEGISFVVEKEEPFELSYITCGLGSNMDALMPNFKLHGQKYTYVLSQNSSFSGEYYKPSELLSEGVVRKTSMDSIIALIVFMPDSEIYDTDVHIMSGVYQTLLIETERKKIRFDMHNGYDTTAAQIITILNSNLPDTVQKLSVFGSHRINR